MQANVKGNSNAGHEYVTRKDGTPLTDDERWQLAEYMKTLQQVPMISPLWAIMTI